MMWPGLIPWEPINRVTDFFALRRHTPDRRRWRVLRKRQLLLLVVVCFLVAFKVVWIVHDDVQSDADRTRLAERRDYLKHLHLAGLLRSNSAVRAMWTNVSEGGRRRAPDRHGHNPRLHALSCPKLFAGDKDEQAAAAERLAAEPKVAVKDVEYLYMSQDCAQFRTKRGYFMKALSSEERAFPIAFSILIYKDVEQVERLLRAIYMPQNYYCIHIDLRASDTVHLTMQNIAGCFPNVFIASKLEEVYWGHISIMHAEMNCLRDLMHFQWKYFINLSGQMFPLHTNSELVKILKLYNGANDIEGTYKRSRVFWLAARQWVTWRLMKSLNTMMITIYPKGNPPHNVTVYKGSNQVAISRDFAMYFLDSSVSQEIITWFSDTLAPDEYIWPTLNHNAHLKAPGSFKGNPETKPFVARASIWLPIANQVGWSWTHWDCQGKWVREICIFGVGDMPWLYNRPELFANKFHSNYQWLAYDCLEELHFNRTHLGSDNTFNSTYYDNLPFVKYPSQVVGPDEADDIDPLQ